MRNKFAIIIKIFITCCFSLLFSAIYSKPSSNHVDGIQDKIGIIYFIVMNQAYSNIFPVLNVFFAEKIVVQKERASGSYRLYTYFFSKVISELPFSILNPVLFVLVSYFTVQLNYDAASFFMFAGTIIMECLAATFSGYFLGAITPEYIIA